MPCAMMHLKCAKNYDDNADIAFYLGNLTPDCMDVREFKDVDHLRIYTDKPQRDQKLTELAKCCDLNDPYQFGVIFHLFTDMEWDHGPMAEHKRNYIGGDWFHDYRNDIRDISKYMFSVYDWAPEMWDRLCEADIEGISAIERYPVKCIREYLEYNRKRHAIPGNGESVKLPHAKMEEFCAETTKLFKHWLIDNNLAGFSKKSF